MFAGLCCSLGVKIAEPNRFDQVWSALGEADKAFDDEQPSFIIVLWHN
jgi:hypothetical protein